MTELTAGSTATERICSKCGARPRSGRNRWCSGCIAASRKRDKRIAVGPQTAQMRAGLEALAVWGRLKDTEWRILGIVLSAANPLSPGQIAAQLKLTDEVLEPVVDELIRWQVLVRTADGLVAFQPAPHRWRNPASVLAPTLLRTGQ